MTLYDVNDNEVLQSLSLSVSLPCEKGGQAGHNPVTSDNAVSKVDMEGGHHVGHDRGHDALVAEWNRRVDSLNEAPADDLAAVLDALRDWFRTFLYTTDIERDSALLALWTAHTYVVTETYTTPRLQISSPEFGSGKSTALEHIERLSFEARRLTGNVSAAFLPRYLADGPRTVLLDEVEKTLKQHKPAYGDIMAVLNDGYRFGAEVPLVVPSGAEGKKWEAGSVPVFAPVCWAGNSPEIPDDTLSRTIRVTMLPDVDGVAAETDWRDHEEVAQSLQEQVQACMEHLRDVVRDSRPNMPDGCRGRLRDVWRPLKTVAALASPEWAMFVDEAVGNALDTHKQDREAGLEKKTPARVMMTDIRSAFESQNPEDGFLESEDLVEHLVRLNKQWWDAHGDYPKLSTHRMGRVLRDAYGISSCKRKVAGPDGHRRRGYYSSLFEASWKSLGPPAEDQ